MTYVPPKQLDHVGDGIEKLAGAAIEKPRIIAWLTVHLRQVQQIEDALYTYIFGVLLDNAIGVHLENIGNLVGEPRAGKSDDRYRLGIRIAAKVNRSNGRVRDLLEILSLAAAYWRFRELGNAKFRVEVQDTDVAELGRWLRKARLGGVGVQLVGATGVGPGFRWSSRAGSVDNPGQWGTRIAAGVGSKLAHSRRA